jgi:hypothetical protein
MPEIDVWPPKPDLPDPLTEYDDVIAAKLTAIPELKQRRILLIKALREDTGMTLVQAYALVNNYYERHGILVKSKATQVFAWSNFGLVSVAMALNCCNLYLSYHRDEILGVPPQHSAFLAFRSDQLAISYAAGVLLLLNIPILILRSRRNRKK